MAVGDYSTGRIAYLIDDDPHMAKAVRLCLQSIGVDTATYDSAESFLEAHPLDPDGCLLVDLKLQGTSGIELLSHIRARGWNVPVIILSGTITIPSAIDALEFGAIEVLQKPASAGSIQNAVEKALLIRRKSAAANLSQLQSSLFNLSDVERDVLRLLLDGELNKSIANQLDIGLRSVVRHRKHILEKLGHVSLPELVRSLTLAGIDLREGQVELYKNPLMHRLRTDYKLHIATHIEALQAKLEQTTDSENGKCIVDTIHLLNDLSTMASYFVPGSEHNVQQGPCVLIISSKEQESQLLAAVLQLSDFNPRVTHSIAKASELCEEFGNQKIPFVLIEERLAQFDLQALRQFLSLPSVEGAERILMNGPIESPNREMLLSEFFDKRLECPFEPLALVDQLVDDFATRFSEESPLKKASPVAGVSAGPPRPKFQQNASRQTRDA